MNANKIYNAALYCRLSLDDGNIGESGSITTQKIILEEYARYNNFKVYDVYVYDGYSGLNFNRLGFQRMLNDIEEKKINLVITKNLSRLGRDYIQTGYYTESYFLDNGVRYIAINDGIDTLNGNNDIAPFKNILNDMYAKDLSRKVKAAKRSRNQRGLYTAAQVPYGYKKNPLDNNHLIIDEEVSSNVKLIYKLALEGHGCPKIARILTERGIVTPGYYKSLKGDTRFNRFKKDGWTYVTVRKILSDIVYLGHIESSRYEVINYKTKKRVKVPQDRHIICKDRHEPIISESDFEFVQSILNSRVHPWKHDEHENLFKGIVFCKHCGNRMALVHQRRNNNNISHCYKCCTRVRDKEACIKPNTLLYRDLKAIVIEDIRYLMSNINKEDFYNRLIEKLEEKKSNRNDIATLKKLESKKENIYKTIKKIYDDNLSGLIDDEMANKMIGEYKIEQDSITKKIKEIESTQEQYKSTIKNYELLKEQINEFLEFKDLDSKMVHSLISRIEIGYREEPREIKIYYKFVNDILV